MIGFESNETTLFTEGIIDDSLKAANIDTDKVKEDWDNAVNAGSVGETIKNVNKAANEDILDPLKKDIDNLKDSANKKSLDRRSLIARSRNSVLQFPVYITQTIRVNEAHIISKLFERVYASLFQTILAQNPIIDQDEVNELVFLKKFHTNINESANFVVLNEFYTPVDEIDEILKESTYNEIPVSDTMKLRYRVVPCMDSFLIKESARLCNEPLTGLDYLKEANTEQVRDDSSAWKVISEKELEEMALDKAGFSDRERKTFEMSAEAIEKEVKAANPGATDKERKEIINRRLKQKKAADDKFHDALDKLKDDIKDGTMTGYKYDGGRYYHLDKSSKITTRPAPEKPIQAAPKAPILLRDVDIKKINGMLPYSIEASFIMQDKAGTPVKEVKFIIGIKTDLHLIRTQDLTEDLREIVTGNIKSLQKVRYKTGEITFMDYLFNTKGIKNDAAKSVNYNKKWLNTLKRLGEWEKTNGSLLKSPANFLAGGNVPIPNGTIVLTQTDVTTMMNQTGIDLSVVSNAKRLARSLFLIAVCIVDSSAGTMRVLFPDSSSDWDVQSLASIDAELSKTDNSQLMRELNRMVNH